MVDDDRSMVRRDGAPHGNWRIWAARMLALLPLAVAAGASVQLASVIWTAVFLPAGGMGAALAYRMLHLDGGRRALCSWDEVERALDRELRRVQRRRFLLRHIPRWSRRRPSAHL